MVYVCINVNRVLVGLFLEEVNNLFLLISVKYFYLKSVIEYVVVIFSVLRGIV